MILSNNRCNAVSTMILAFRVSLEKPERFFIHRLLRKFYSHFLASEKREDYLFIILK